MTLATRALSVCTATALAIGGALLLPASASAAGVGDVSGAVLYDGSSPIGDVLSISTEDDGEETIALPFTVNFFGVASDALCVNTNGLVAPVPTTADGCGDNYDVDLAYYADDYEQSVVGALLADNDPGEVLWKDSGIAITSYSIASEIVTFTTAAPHGLTAGDFAYTFFPDGFWDGYTGNYIIDAPTTTTFTVDFSGSGLPDTASTPLTSGRLGDPYAEGESDGFGEVTAIYAGATTVDGKPAFAVTWYRVPTNDYDNEPWFSNTYQIVLVQEPTGGASGSDVTFHFNFATMTDDNDGYLAGDGSEECDSDEPVDCRWAVGLAGYDAVSGAVQEYELFADIPVTELVDGGAHALVSNSLNSDVAGRYILKMVNGQVVETAPQLAATGAEPVTVLVPAAALALLVGAGLLIARRRTAS
ncbi:hypothetical protein [Schumannella luteola]